MHLRETKGTIKEDTVVFIFILLMEEVLHHLGCLKKNHVNNGTFFSKQIYTIHFWSQLSIRDQGPWCLRMMSWRMFVLRLGFEMDLGNIRNGHAMPQLTNWVGTKTWNMEETRCSLCKYQLKSWLIWDFLTESMDINQVQMLYFIDTLNLSDHPASTSKALYLNMVSHGFASNPLVMFFCWTQRAIHAEHLGIHAWFLILGTGYSNTMTWYRDSISFSHSILSFQYDSFRSRQFQFLLIFVGDGQVYVITSNMRRSSKQRHSPSPDGRLGSHLVGQLAC